ncbi:hypothetical protein OSB04_018292 [Centaurea solstitialis]|uniref:ARS-binding protein 1 N-terminal domain-containing protein n=1 Tax=Centaurea solstitialis TaxID=347529 RepID=A0AA38TML8_9ASTR|nr:hypothetical protein OSB04_018292 [Centaurea solstitialis]
MKCLGIKFGSMKQARKDEFIIDAIRQAYVWVVWKGSNDEIFNGNTFSTFQAANNIQSLVFSWYHNKSSSRKSTSWVDWSCNPTMGVKKTTMTDEIRRALCKHNKNNPSLTQKQLQEWVHSNYGLQVSQAAISNTVKQGKTMSNDDDHHMILIDATNIKYGGKQNVCGGVTNMKGGLGGGCGWDKVVGMDVVEGRNQWWRSLLMNVIRNCQRNYGGIRSVPGGVTNMQGDIGHGRG